MLNSCAQFFVDCQSTGSSPSTSELLEIAWNDQSWVLQQGQPVPSRIMKLIGLSADEIAAGTPQALVWEELDREIRNASSDGSRKAFVVAHFARFEQGYLDRMWQTHDGVSFPLPIFCTHRIAKLLFPRLPNYGLRALAGWFGAPLDEGKRASSHVNATRHIWRALTEELSNRGIVTLDQLAEFCAQKPARATGRREFLIPREKRLGLPDSPGIYRYIDRNGRILYVGKASSLKQRVNSYFTGGCRGDHRKLEMLAQATDFEIEIVDTPLNAGLREFDEIRRLKPPYNIAFKGRGHNPDEALTLLVGSVVQRSFETDRRVIRDAFYGLDDLEILKEGIRLWRLSHGIAVDQELSARRLLNMGIPLLKEWIAAERLRIEARKQAEESEAIEEAEEADDESDETESDEFVWTPELVAEACTRIVRRAARHHVRMRWLRRIAGATIRFTPGAGRGRKRKAEIQELEITPTGSIFEADEPRRTRVLLHELRRAESKGGSWRVIKPWSMTVPFWV